MAADTVYYRRKPLADCTDEELEKAVLYLTRAFIRTRKSHIQEMSMAGLFNSEKMGPEAIDSFNSSIVEYKNMGEQILTELEKRKQEKNNG